MSKKKSRAAEITVEIVVILLSVGLSTLFRRLAAEKLSGTGLVTVIPKVLGLRYVEKTGAAFSLMSGKSVFLVGVTGVMIVFLIFLLMSGKVGSAAVKAALVMIISGGIGNLIERIFYKFVVDYFDFLFMKFAVFNFSDTLITLGAAVIVIWVIADAFFGKKKKTEGDIPEKEENS